MATVSQVRSSDPAKLTAVAAGLSTLNTSFTQAVDDMHRGFDTVLMTWKGSAAARASIRAADEHVAGNHVGTAVNAVIDALDNAAGALGPARQTVVTIADEAVSAGCIVDEDGHVRAPDMGEAKLQTIADDRARTYDARLFSALTTFNELDATHAAALATAITQLQALVKQPEGAPLSAPVQSILDGREKLPADPKAFHDFWVGLTPAEKDALWKQDQYLGNKDGMPVVDRDRYNRVKLDDEYTRASSAQAQVDALRREHPQWVNPNNVLDSERAAYQVWKNRYDDAATRARFLPDLQQIQNQLHKGGEATAPLDPNRKLLLLDTQTGENAHTAIAIGNPDTASHVSTYVPGTGSEPSKMSEDMLRCLRMQKEAALNGAADTAVIAWFGYDSPPTAINGPQHLWPGQNDDASEIRYADAAAPALDRFQSGLRVTHDGAPSYNTVLGHSYGTTVVGDAAAHGRTLDADAVVLVASPGATVDHASELHLTGVPQDQVAERIFATKAENDPVPLASHERAIRVDALEKIPRIGWLLGALAGGDDADGGPFGMDPAESDFGGRVFDSDPGDSTPVVGYSFDAHSQYWDYHDGEPCTSLENIGKVLAGRDPAAR